jgi:hypothetical protein
MRPVPFRPGTRWAHLGFLKVKFPSVRFRTEDLGAATPLEFKFKFKVKFKLVELVDEGAGEEASEVA